MGRFPILDGHSAPRRALLAAVLFGLLFLLWAWVGTIAQTPVDAKATAETESFADVPPGSPYQTAIDSLHDAGIVSGYQENGAWLFKPGNPIWRAQFAKMICEVLDLSVTEGSAPPFTDVGPNDPTTLYPHEYVAAVASRGITTGTSFGLFSPWNNVTRAQLVTMIVRAANAAAPGTLSTPPTGFSGALGDFDSSHAPAMRTAEWNGLLTGLLGFDAEWDPWAAASRGEAAEMLARLWALVAPDDGGPTTTTTSPPVSTTTTAPSASTTTTAPPAGTTTTTTAAPPSSTTTTTAPGGSQPLGPNVAINFRLFPADNPWNADISAYPVHPLSSRYVAAIGASTHLHPDFGTVWNGAPNGIPYVVVSGNQPKVPVSFYYPDESDPGPYPIPADAPIEGGPNGTGDRHILILDADHRLLYELYDAHPAGDHWEAGSGAIFDLTSNALRPDTWTSADAAGLPLLPGLVRYDEVASGEITHALRFTVDQTQRAFIHPATHYASDDTDPDLPPVGLRLRLRGDYSISGYPQKVQVILRALQRYGMIIADNGSSWYISGAPDPRWDDDELRTISQIPGSAFEAVYTGPIITP